MVRSDGGPHVFRLRQGDDLLLSIREYAIQHNIHAAYIGACVGCVLEATLRDASGVTVRHIPEFMEIVSLTGTVSKERTHLHIALSKEDLSTIGGHLMEGCHINTTAEIVLCELPSMVFHPVWDPDTGYQELAWEHHANL